MDTKTINFDKLSHIKDSIVTIGKFNGVHLGHQKLIKYVVDKALLLNMTSVVITFKMESKTIYNFDDNIKLLKKLGVNYIVVIDFSSEFYKMNYREFFYKIIEYYNAKEIVVGNDFAFGYNREGTISILRSLCEQLGIDATIFSFILYENNKISSTTIKKCIENGDVELASRLLGRTYSYSSIIEKGRFLGNTIDFPTANSAVNENVVLPKEGVYFSTSTVEDENKEHISMTCIGKTSLNSGVKFETYIFDYDRAIYGKNIEVKLFHYHRSNIKLDSLEQLKIILNKDKLSTYQYFKRRDL